MKRLVKHNENIYAGVRIEKGELKFDWRNDNLTDDVILLSEAVSGQYDADGVQFIYGYHFNPDSTKRDRDTFRRFLKDLPQTNDIYSKDVDRFVEEAVLALDTYHKLEDFKATVFSESSHEFSVLDVMRQYFTEYCRNLTFSFELLKKAYSDVQFDADKAANALREAGFQEHEISREINFTKKKFEALKSDGKLFEMKRFIPREIREGFFDFFKFRNDEEKELYVTLQGVDVLIYDDFLTSGTTIREIIRYLRSFNDNNRLTVFVLIKQ